MSPRLVIVDYITGCNFYCNMSPNKTAGQVARQVASLQCKSALKRWQCVCVLCESWKRVSRKLLESNPGKLEGKFTPLISSYKGEPVAGWSSFSKLTSYSSSSSYIFGNLRALWLQPPTSMCDNLHEARIVCSRHQRDVEMATSQS